MIDLNSSRVQTALQAVGLASLLIRQVQAEMALHATTKVDHTPVTVADFAAQVLVGSLLSEHFPNFPLLAEEDSETLLANNLQDQVLAFVTRFIPGATLEQVIHWLDHGRISPRSQFWVLDPVDGTKGFLRNDQYAVAMALIVDGQVELGLLGCPNLVEAYRPDQDGPGSLVIAQRGCGAWTTSLEADWRSAHFTRLQVSTRQDPSQARLLLSHDGAHTNLPLIARLAHSLSVQPEPLRIDSQVKCAIMAAGKGELIIRMLPESRPSYREKIWDLAPGAVIVSEAGGRVTDLDGKPIDFTSGRTLVNNRGVLASNGYLHSAALQALRLVEA